MRRVESKPVPLFPGPNDVFAAIGRGIFAGLAGTAVMTAGQRVEMRLRGRQGSTSPGDLVAGLLGVEAIDEAQRRRFSDLVHWTWGTGWGVPRGLLRSFGLRGVPVVVAHFTMVVGTDCWPLASRGLAPPPWRWTRQELIFELLHKGVLVGTTHLAFRLLEP